MGVPRKEFGLRVNFLNGRLEDTLGQLASFVHAMYELNLVLFVRSILSTSNSVMLCFSDSFDEEFGIYDGDEGTLRDYIFEVASSCTFSLSLIRQLSTSLFSRLPSRESLSLPSDALVVHIRAGDALFRGALTLPPLSY